MQEKPPGVQSSIRGGFSPTSLLERGSVGDKRELHNFLDRCPGFRRAVGDSRLVQLATKAVAFEQAA